MKSKINIYELEAEFAPSSDIFDETLLPCIKKIMVDKLSDTERRILVLYCNYGSCRKTAEVTSIGYRQIAIVVNAAIKKIRTELKRIETKNNKIIK